MSEADQFWEYAAAVVGTGEHFSKRSPLLDQLRGRLF